MPTIILNGDERQVDPMTTVGGLLEQLGLDLRQVAVEKNRQIIPRAELHRTSVAEGDTLEVVTFVGGG